MRGDGQRPAHLAGALDAIAPPGAQLQATGVLPGAPAGPALQRPWGGAGLFGKYLGRAEENLFLFKKTNKAKKKIFFSRVLGEGLGCGERTPLEEMAFFLKAKNKQTKPHNRLASPAPRVRPSGAPRRPHASPGRAHASECTRARGLLCEYI